MDGVTILNTESVPVADFSFKHAIIVVVLIFVFCVSIGVFLAYMDNNREMIPYFLLVAFATSIPLSIFTGVLCSDDYETQYQVTIDETVSMSEFLDKYEIIDSNGDIYTIRIKGE